VADEIAPKSISQIIAPRGLGSTLGSQQPAGPKTAGKTVGKIVGKITWQKAGRVVEPGRYMHRFGWLTVTAEDLAVWRQYPQAEFTLLQLPKPSRNAPAEDALLNLDEYHLGTFELPR
jgi:hypothetical protein